MKRLLLLVFATTMGMAMAVAQQSEETKRMQDRFLSYVSIESQSVYPSDTDTFPITQNQKKIANLIFNEL